MTVAANVFGYLGDYLPGLEHTDVDRCLVQAFGQLFHRSPSRTVGNLASDAAAKARKEYWRRCLGRFFLALADQQMLNSLAIMIATFAMWDEISVYTLWIAWALAVATLTTHLATMRLFPVYANPLLNTQTSRLPIS
jgi:hypothetical protein